MTDQQVETAFCVELGRKLREKRRQRGMSLEAVAHGLRTYRNQVWRWELGLAPMTPWDLMRIADVLCCNHVVLLPSRGFTWGEALLPQNEPDATPAEKKAAQRERDPELSREERRFG